MGIRNQAAAEWRSMPRTKARAPKRRASAAEEVSERDRRHPDEKSRHLLTQLVLLAFVCIDVFKTYD